MFGLETVVQGCAIDGITKSEARCMIYLGWKHLPGIHDSMGIEQLLDLFHPFDARLILTVSQRTCLRVPNTVFSGDGSIV